MSVLLLRLAGPLQSWGASSRFTRRETRREPTKSGIIGLLACAQGRGREDSIQDLLQLHFGVRTDQRGSLVSDYQTAKMLPWHTREQVVNMPLSSRHYLSDAKFLAAVEGPDEIIKTLDYALRHPVWPLFLGRRSCPPEFPICLGISKYETAEQALVREPWIAARWYRHAHAQETLAIAIDAAASSQCKGHADSNLAVKDVIAGNGMERELVADDPVSFSQLHREYELRSVVHFVVRPDELDGAEVGMANESNLSDSVQGCIGRNGQTFRSSIPPIPADHDPMDF